MLQMAYLYDLEQLAIQLIYSNINLFLYKVFTDNTHEKLD